MQLLVAAVLLLQPQDTSILREFDSVLKSAPIEAFDSLSVATVVRGALLADLDADGQPEGVVWIRPGLRQTPTVLLFKRSGSGGWTRIAEGLAPGRLSPVSGRMRDTHTFGAGVDLTAGDGSAVVAERVLAAGSASRMSLVAYAGFFHGDARKDAIFIVDLQKWPLPPGTGKTCEAFEFPPVEAVRVGTLSGADQRQYVVALTPDDVTLYHISSIASSGRLAATSVLRTRAPDVTGLSHDGTGNVVFTTRDGTRPVAAP